MSQMSNKPGFGALRGSKNSKITVITTLPTSSYFPDSPKEKDLVFDATVTPIKVYIYKSGIWHS